MIIQNLKSDLNTHYRTVSNSDYQNYSDNLVRFINYIDDTEILKNITLEMELKHPEINKDSLEYIENKNECINYRTVEKNAVLKWCIIKNAIILKGEYLENFILDFTHSYLQCNDSQLDSINDNFNRNIVEPFYNYLVSSLNNTNVTLHTLVKFKHRSEWFRKKYLYELFESDTTKGEENLNDDFYEYLFDQGIDFHIEPKSESGRPDLIESQKGNNRLIADGKIFDTEKSKGKSYIINGFNQVYTYTKTYNNSLGYLIIFKTCEKELVLNFSKREQETFYITHNGKTIFFLIIDIFPYKESASRRGKQEAIEITESEFVTILNE